MTRLLRSLLALLAIGVVIVGVPIVLWVLAPPVEVFDRDWVAVLTMPDDGRVLIAALTVAAWCAWLMVATSLVSELIGQLSNGRWAPTIGAIGWLRPMSAALVGAALGAWLLSGPSPAGSLMTPAVSTSQTTTTPSPVSETVVAHRVVDGDDLWSLAETYFGDGTQWRRIIESNPRLHPDRELAVGSVVRLHDVTPADGTADGTPADGTHPPTAAGEIIEVAEGDTLWALAESRLGAGERWPEIVAANPELIEDPDQIQPGWRLVLPSPERSSPERSSPERSSPERSSPERSSPERSAGREVAELSDQARQQLADEAAAEDARISADLDADESMEPAPVQPEHSRQQPEHKAPNQLPVSVDLAAETAAERASLAALGLGVTLASVVTSSWRHRRRLRLRQRPPGTRLAQLGKGAAEFEGALHWLAETHELPGDPTPATVVLGADSSGRDLCLDLAAHRIIGIDATEQQLVGLLGSFATCVACADWATGVRVTVIGAELDWVSTFDHPGIRHAASLAAALPGWVSSAAARRAAGDDLADDVPPELMFVTSPPTDQEWQALTASAPGMTVVCPINPERSGGCDRVLTLTSDAGRVDDGTHFVPQLIHEPARRALIELGTSISSAATLPAPWWASGPPDGIAVIHSAPIIQQPTEGGESMSATSTATTATAVSTTGHPLVRVLGGVDVLQARGEAPARASRQCAEYCAWLLRNPGRTAATMGQALLVAEGTRRSNMSRLRNWLGFTDEGELYLPEAYTGRITLDPRISSDWEQIQHLIGAGVNLTHNQGLADALTWVRGEPFADAAPSQWHWAEEWRTDMISTVRDIALVLAERCLGSSDPATAKWAIQRGLLANPDDEFLLATLVRIESQLGNQSAAERLVHLLARRARSSGVDLLPETVQVLQVAMEGKPRSRQA